MDPKDLEKFDPTVAELTKLVEATKDIKADDLENPAQLSIVRENRISLKNARVRIEKKGKELREEAVKFQKDVIAKEKELIAIIEPEELRLKGIEEEAKRQAIRKERLLGLPERKARIEVIPHVVMPHDDDILNMDEIEFGSFINSLVAYSNEIIKKKQEEEAEAKRLALEAEAEEKRKEHEAQMEKERIEIQKEKDRIKAENDAKEKEIKEKEHAIEIEKAKIETEKRIKAEQEEKERIALEDKRKEEEMLALQKKELEERTALEKKRLEEQEAYQKFLKDNGYTPAAAHNFKIDDSGGEVVLYKKVAVFKKK